MNPTTGAGHALDRHTALAASIALAALVRSAYRFWHRYDDDDDDDDHAYTSINSSSNDSRDRTSAHDYNNKNNSNIVPSPLKTLTPRLSPLEAANLPYPPHGALPGQRDVQTPYGSIRVYEWGPEDGERVLMVHGISTPCIALGDLGRELVRKGHRVCVFDLFGRGYSDAPVNQIHNTQLYTTQILLVLASSSLPWLSTATFPASSASSTNPLLQSPPTSSASPSDKGGFHLMGYSLGSCLCVSFASNFPDKLRSLSLIAPSGQIRGYHISRQSRLLYDSGWIPEGVVRWIVGRRIRPADRPAVEGAGVLNGDINGLGKVVDKEGVNGSSAGSASEPADIAVAEATTSTASTAHFPPSSLSSSPSSSSSSRKKSAHSDATGGQAFDSAPLSLKHYPPHVTVSSVVRWQVDHHHGFLDAFLSTIRNAPIYQPKGSEDWARLRETLHGVNNGGGGGGGNGARDRKSWDGRRNASNGNDRETTGLARKGKVLVVLGGQDSVIDKDETVEDVTAALGGGCVDFEVLEGAGHEIVITESEKVGRILSKHFARF